VLDLAEKKKTVTDLKSKDQQVKYIAEMRASDRANLSLRSGVATPVGSITEKDFAVTPAPKAKRAPETECGPHDRSSQVMQADDSRREDKRYLREAEDSSACETRSFHRRPSAGVSGNVGG